MCDGDLDTILSHISSKINKIFCDREFVGCVKEDLDIILQNENCCVLFPKLKPIFLKVLRYEAVIFDLSVFCIGSGPNQVAVVCKKAFLKEKTDECPPIQVQKVPKSMDAEENSSKSSQKKLSRVRPTQSYYVPPAQRSTSKKCDQENKTSKKAQITSTSKLKNVKKCKHLEETANTNVSRTRKTCDNKIKVQEGSDDEIPSLENPNCNLNAIEQNANKSGDILTTSENSSQILYNEPLLPRNIFESQKHDLSLNESIQELPNPEQVQYNEEQGTVQNISKFSKDIENANPIENTIYLQESSNLASSHCATQHMDQITEVQKSDLNSAVTTEEILFGPGNQTNTVISATDNIENQKSFKIKLGLSDLQSVAELILQENENESTDTSLKEEELKEVIECLKIIIAEEEEQFEYEEDKCAIIEQDIKEQLKQRYFKFNISHCKKHSNKEPDCNQFNSITLSDSTRDSRCEIDSDVESITPPPPQMPDLENVTTEQVIDESRSSELSSLYISYNENVHGMKSLDCDIDNEKEEMQRAIENINRKIRPLIKHISNDNTLRINEDNETVQRSSGVTENKKNTMTKHSEKGSGIDQSNLSTWEDMFDEDGELQQEYIGEIVKHIGCEVTVVKASHDYSAYQNTKYQDLEHVIELYDFPSTLKTQDLMQLYRGAYQEAMYVKWCDDTHALLVLSSPAQAKRALQIEHDIIKSRPLSEASSVAALTASSSDLKPAMKRPQTNMQTARRLINTHLGTRSALSKEEVEQERQALRDAREQRRLERQNEKDAWEGRPRNAKI